MYDPPWVTKTGQILRIGDMSEAHICNCIALIERSKSWRREYLSRLRLELDIRQLGLRKYG